jgi:hypothetical protein
MYMKTDNYDVDTSIDLLELNEERLYAWLVLDSPTVVRDDLEGAAEHVQRLRETIKAQRPEYVSPYEDVLAF